MECNYVKKNTLPQMKDRYGNIMKAIYESINYLQIPNTWTKYIWMNVIDDYYLYYRKYCEEMNYLTYYKFTEDKILMKKWDKKLEKIRFIVILIINQHY